MREIHEHKVNGCNENIAVHVVDKPGSGDARHEYCVTIGALHGEQKVVNLSFQNGPIAEVGTNGITQEVLITICIDRLRSFQGGPYACRENSLALTKLEEALHWLNHRTIERRKRGVEGSYKA